MAKKKTSNQSELFAKIANITGGDVLGNLDSIKYFIDTGNFAINYACCGKFIDGGVPGNRITEIYGPSSSGKSLIAANILFGTQKLDGWPVLLDCENASNGEFMAKASKVDLQRVIRQTPMCLEDAFHSMHTTTAEIRALEKKEGLDRKPIVFVYDSIAVSPCQRELSETKLPANYKASDWKRIVGRKEQPGERAKVCSKEFRKLQALLEKEDISVIVLNQTREKIGVMYGNPETTGGGGNALPFYASLRLRTQAKKKIENNRLGSFAGINMQIKNVKNRTFRPFVIAEDVRLYFRSGINPLSGILQCLIEEERVGIKGAGNFFVVPDFLPEGVSEYKFKATKAENTVKEQVLIDCPALIGAENSEQVKSYLDNFRLALNSGLSDDFIEKESSYDSDGNALFVEEDEEINEEGED